MTESRFESCIVLIRQGSRDGLKEIYSEYGKFIYSVMFSAVNDPHNAEDLTSDFFLKLWDKLADTYQLGRGHKRWLSAAAHNMAVDFLRKNGREQLILDNEDADNGQAYELPDSIETENTVISDMTVNDALKVLDGSEREIVSLKLLSDMTFKEIALILNKPSGTVSWKYRSALAKLRKYIKEVQKL